MRTADEAALDDSFPLETVREILRRHPVRAGILFGSHATGESDSRSDIDIAVDFETVRTGDPEYNEVLFGLSADLSEALETDAIDLIDIRTASPELARAIFDRGVLLVGETEHVASLRDELASTATTDRSPRERFDAAVAKIDAHLEGSAVTATDDEIRER